MKYSPKTGGFYSERVHGTAIPTDAVEISMGAYLDLMTKQAEGARILVSAAGYPYAAEQKKRPASTREEIEALRLIAYADPLKGSDRHFSESNRERLLGNAEAAEAAKVNGFSRFAEIRAEYPWPDSSDVV
ncbi:hypothetical protein [Pseudomonas alvandae]|jgi:hypothetical protein|uniref:hypothetical protein n=1 Tax=Pseudomonas canavaninivorans TaxID=2842348 RepID=UPI00215EA5F7|nr:hypothetical protein [Pseudomonas canavaninivorans]UVM71380.1 hypothetical protein LOY40_22785 [Pseudomonas canavaninivorans]